MAHAMTDQAKERVLRHMIAARGPIVTVDDFYDAYRVIDHEGLLCLDHYSPREHLSYSITPIPIADAWQRALSVCPDEVEQFAAIVGAEDFPRAIRNTDDSTRSAD